MTEYLPADIEDTNDDRRAPMARRAAWWLIGGIGVVLGIIVVFGLRQPIGDPGPLKETLYTLPSKVPAPSLSDASSASRLGLWSIHPDLT